MWEKRNSGIFGQQTRGLRVNHNLDELINCPIYVFVYKYKSLLYLDEYLRSTRNKKNSICQASLVDQSIKIHVFNFT